MEDDKLPRYSSRSWSEERNEHGLDSSSLASSHRSPHSSRPSTSFSSASSNFSRNQVVWNLFQEAAANTSRLYQAQAAGRDGHWTNFQNAASSISMLYKESLDAQQHSYDAGYRNGVEKAYNELMDWLVQDPRYNRCKMIRGEDLVKFVYSPKNPATFETRVRSGTSKSHDTNYSSISSQPTSAEQPLEELETFRDALHVSSLNGAMSHFSVNRSPPRTNSSSRARSVDLHAFVTDEIRRHKRKSGDSSDIEDEEFAHLKPFKRSRFGSPSH